MLLTSQEDHCQEIVSVISQCLSYSSQLNIFSVLLAESHKLTYLNVLTCRKTVSNQSVNSALTLGNVSDYFISFVFFCISI